MDGSEADGVGVGSAVGDTVGDAVGVPVGPAVGVTVGVGVGAPVGVSPTHTSSMNEFWVLAADQERIPTRSPVSTDVAGSPVSVQTGSGQVFGSGPNSVAERKISTTVSVPVPAIVAPNQSPFCTELGSVHTSGLSTNASSST